MRRVLIIKKVYNQGNNWYRLEGEDDRFYFNDRYYHVVFESTRIKKYETAFGIVVEKGDPLTDEECSVRKLSILSNRGPLVTITNSEGEIIEQKRLIYSKIGMAVHKQIEKENRLKSIGPCL